MTNTQKKFENAQNELNSIQELITDKQRQKGQLVKAKEIIEAQLIIEPSSKTAKSQVEKAEKAIQAIEKELAGLTEKQNKAQENYSKALADLNNEKGESFKADFVNKLASNKVQSGLIQIVEQIEKKLELYPHTNWEDWSKAYGLPLQAVQTPSGVRYEARRENTSFLKQKKTEAEQMAYEKANEVLLKVMVAVEQILEEEGLK